MKRHLYWIIEAFVWLLILISVSCAIMFVDFNNKKINTYHLFLPDVDGLIKGSPVKYMGIQIGYISQINIIEDKVFLTFVITEKNMKLPKGVHATVEFSGLGGAKSLEIYPPQGNDNSTKFIIEEPPKRIGDSLDLLYKMFNDIAEITYTVSGFINKFNNMDTLDTELYDKINTNYANQLLNSTNMWFDKSQERLDNLNKNLDGENDDRKFRQ